MNKKMAFVALLSLAGTFSLPATAGTLERVEEPVPGRYIVALNIEQGGGSAATVIERLAERLTRKYGGEILHIYGSVLGGFAVQIEESRAAAIARDAMVAFVEPDSVMRKLADPAGKRQAAAGWGLDRIDSRDRTLDGYYDYQADGRDVHIYLLDTGLHATHAEFSGRVGEGYSALDDERGTGDCQGHGTHVASIAAGKRHGVAKAATVHPVRVLGCSGNGRNSDVIAGINWVVRRGERPAVINLSLGGNGSRALDRAVRDTMRQDIPVIVAAGNADDDACNSSPARAPSAITVAASNRRDRRADFSSYGKCVDLFAPGTEIEGAWFSGNQATATLSGTSMAAPFVAGAAAQYLGGHHEASAEQVAEFLLETATRDKLRSIGSDSPDRLLYAVIPVGTSPPPPPREEIVEDDDDDDDDDDYVPPDDDDDDDDDDGNQSQEELCRLLPVC